MHAVPVRASAQRTVRRWIAFAAVAYPAALLAAIAALRCVGERWWLTGAALYLPRIGFALPLPPLAAALAACRMRRLLAAQALSVVLLLFPLMGFVPPRLRLGHEASGPEMRVMSFNVNKGEAGVQALVGAIDRYAPDLVLLQEIYAGSNDPLVAALRARYASVDSTDQFVIASRMPLSSVRAPEKFRYDGAMHSPRFMRYTAETPLGPMAIYSVHPVSPRPGFYRIRGAGLRREIASGRLFEGAAAPAVQANSGLRAAELEAVARSLRSEHGPVLVAGDTNLPNLSPLLARFAPGLEDGFGQTGWGFGYTFPAKRPWMRIDRVFASPEFVFERFEVGCAGASDHLCVVADLRRR